MCRIIHVHGEDDYVNDTGDDDGSNIKDVDADIDGGGGCEDRQECDLWVSWHYVVTVLLLIL